MEIYCDGPSRSGGAQKGQTSSSRPSGSGQQMDEIKITDQMHAFAPFLSTALIGCVLQALKGRWLGWKNFIVSAGCAGFGAWLVFQLTGEVLSEAWGQFAAGMVGYSGGTLVDVALASFTRKVEKLDKLTKLSGPNDNMED